MELEQIKRDPIGMILSFSVPAILSMVLTALITVADGAFIGNFVGKDSIASLNLGSVSYTPLTLQTISSV